MKNFCLVILSPIFTLSMLSGCAWTRRVGVRSAVPVLEQGQIAVQKVGDWHQFVSSVPGNLLMLEGLLEQDPENKDILALLVQGHVGLSFGGHETLLLKKGSGAEGKRHRRSALYHYRQALRYADRFLDAYAGTSLSRLKKFTLKRQKLLEILQTDFSGTQARKVLFYTAMAMNGLGNLQRDQMQIIGFLPFAESLTVHACSAEEAERIFYQLCPLLVSLPNLIRPKTLGGEPKKASSEILAFYRAHPYHLIYPLLYYQFYLRKKSQTEQEKRWVDGLASAFEAFKLRHRQRLGRPSEKIQSFLDRPQLELFNAIALQRFEFLMEN